MEDDLNIFENGRRPKFFENGRRSQFFSKLKLTSYEIMQPNKTKIKTILFLKMEDNLNIFQMEEDLQKIKQPKTIKNQRVVAPFRVT